MIDNIWREGLHVAIDEPGDISIWFNYTYKETQYSKSISFNHLQDLVKFDIERELGIAIQQAKEEQ